MESGRIYTIIDIETDGIYATQANILEVGYIQINKDLKILRHGSFYFYKDHYQIENEAQKAHKLERSFLAQRKDDFDKSVAKLFTLYYKGDIIGKNSNRFDIPCIQANLRRYSPDFDYLPPVSSFWDVQTEFAPIFKKEWTKRFNEPTRKSGTLEEYMTILGYPQDVLKAKFRELFPDEPRVAAHCALYDVFMTYLVVKDLCENHGCSLDIPRKIVSAEEMEKIRMEEETGDSDYGYEI